MFDHTIANLTKPNQAKALLKMFQAIRKDEGGTKARSMARAVFFCSVAICYELNNLNNLADAHVPDSELSERSLDPVFEDGDISDLAIHEIVRLCNIYPELEEAIDKQYGFATVDTWRTTYGGNTSQHASLAAPKQALQFALF